MDAAAASALIEDFFIVNDEQILLGEGPSVRTSILIDEFCVDGPGVFMFELNVNYMKSNQDQFSEEGVPNISSVLSINNEVVASTFTFKDEGSSVNTGLFYEGVLSGKAQVKVLVFKEGLDLVIDPKELQWGYKLYG